MELLPKDIVYLDSHNYKYDLYTEPTQICIVIRDYQLPDIYDHASTDILVKVPKGYPLTNIDMFWVNPSIKLRSTSSFPAQADIFENILNLSWQRFSRHYPWKPSYSLANHMKVVQKCLNPEEATNV